jgi:hypothetical protein
VVGWVVGGTEEGSIAFGLMMASDIIDFDGGVSVATEDVDHPSSRRESRLTGGVQREVLISEMSRPVAALSRMGYTIGMKTAVSLPDDVFRAAEKHARRAKKSRSQLYAEAISEYLARHTPDEVTEAMNKVIDQLKEPADPFVSAAARRIVKRSQW